VLEVGWALGRLRLAVTEWDLPSKTDSGETARPGLDTEQPVVRPVLQDRGHGLGLLLPQVFVTLTHARSEQLCSVVI